MEIPIELFSVFIGIFISIGIFGFIRQPQIPVMIVVSGIFILTLGAITTEIDMGAIPTNSTTTGSTTTYNFRDNPFDFTEMHKTLMLLVGAIFMFVGGFMVYRE